MTIYVYIIGDSEVDVWGLSGRERLKRMLRTFREQIILVDEFNNIPKGSKVLFLCADHLFDARVLSALVNIKSNLVLNSSNNEIVAIRVADCDAPNVLAYFQGDGNGQTISALSKYTLDDLNLELQQKSLKNKAVPYVLFISSSNYKMLESELFAGSYKGVTDLVTKWAWPVPAFWTTHLCIKIGLRPNHVTLISLVFAVLAGIAFWYGDYGIGLIMGWIMTFLDTVDGKLARVTVTSSRFGDVLDHGLDIIHPPLWYMAWGMGLASISIPDLQLLIWLMFIGYIGGRVCEGAFLWLASFDMFIWRKFDSFNRLVTARRNPNLILLTCSWLINQPELGFLSVVIWHLFSTIILAIRVVIAWQVRRNYGPLRPWFEDIKQGRNEGELAIRIFTRTPVSINDRRATN